MLVSLPARMRTGEPSRPPSLYRLWALLGDFLEGSEEWVLGGCPGNGEGAYLFLLTLHCSIGAEG